MGVGDISTDVAACVLKVHKQPQCQCWLYGGLVVKRCLEGVLVDQRHVLESVII